MYIYLYTLSPPKMDICTYIISAPLLADQSCVSIDRRKGEEMASV